MRTFTHAFVNFILEFVVGEITKDAIIFDDGTELKADIIVLATGYQV